MGSKHEINLVVAFSAGCYYPAKANLASATDVLKTVARRHAMVSWVFAASLAWLSLSAPSEFGPIPPLAPSRIVGELPDGAQKVVGRVLGRLVFEGMPLGRVRWLLGEHQPHLKPLPTGGVVGGVCFGRFDYVDYGLSIDFMSGMDGILRVRRVSRTP